MAKSVSVSFGEIQRLSDSKDPEILRSLLIGLSRHGSPRVKAMRTKIEWRLQVIEKGFENMQDEYSEMIQHFTRNIAEQAREVLQMQKQAAMYQAKLAQSEDERASLQRRLTHAESELRKAKVRVQAAPVEKSEEEKLYGKVGLTPKCTDFVLEAARRAYLKALHPDSLGPAQTQIKRAASDKFKQAFEIFEKIEARRSGKR